MSDVDLAGKPIREPGSTGRTGSRGRYTKEERQAASRAKQQAYWAQRFAAATSPLDALRVAADQASTVALQQERRAATALKRAQRSGNPAAIRQAELRLEATRAAISKEVNEIIDTLVAFTERHETIRV